MNKKVKKEWVAALRSGEYKKGTGALKTQRGNFCCLGVLTDLYKNSKANKSKVKWEKYGSFDGEQGVTPDIVIAWAGLKKANPHVKLPDGEQSNLAAVNDGNSTLGRKTTFIQIADLIEAQL